MICALHCRHLSLCTEMKTVLLKGIVKRHIAAAVAQLAKTTKMSENARYQSISALTLAIQFCALSLSKGVSCKAMRERNRHGCALMNGLVLHGRWWAHEATSLLTRPVDPPSPVRDEDRPVQGPINQEPEEKLFSYGKASGIRKLWAPLYYPHFFSPLWIGWTRETLLEMYLVFSCCVLELLAFFECIKYCLCSCYSAANCWQLNSKFRNASTFSSMIIQVFFRIYYVIVVQIPLARDCHFRQCGGTTKPWWQLS